MMKTPREHFPAGYPLPTNEESRKYSQIWARAFEIHATAHDFDAVPAWCDERGITWHRGPRKGIISAFDETDPTYCDCYERAYQEFKKLYEQTKDVFDKDQPIFLGGVLGASRRIRLEN